MVVDNKARDRFELAVDGVMAFLLYKRTPDALALIHTEVPEAARGRRAGEALVEAALESARSEGLRIIPICPFAKAYIRRHSARREAGSGAGAGA
jgi:predicted GNAT family acetyltransferase